MAKSMKEFLTIWFGEDSFPKMYDVLINSSVAVYSRVLRCTVKNSPISGESRIRKTDVSQCIITDSYLSDSDDAVSKILTGVKLEKNKKLKRKINVVRR